MIIAGTGHRPNKLNNEYNHNGPMSKWISQEIRTIFKKENPTQIITGMALGFDTILCQVALEMNIPVVAAIPFIGQENAWPQKSKDKYHELLNNSLVEKVIVSSGGYATWKMQTRNIWMMDRGDKILACFDGTKGGTKNAHDYAVKIGKPIIRIDPNDYAS